MQANNKCMLHLLPVDDNRVRWGFIPVSAAFLVAASTEKEGNTGQTQWVLVFQASVAVELLCWLFVGSILLTSPSHHQDVNDPRVKKQVIFLFCLGYLHCDGTEKPTRKRHRLNITLTYIYCVPSVYLSLLFCSYFVVSRFFMFCSCFVYFYFCLY